MELTNLFVRKHRNIIAFIATVVSVFLGCRIGSSSWDISHTVAEITQDVNMADQTSSATKVCYINSNTDSTSYYTIEQALQKAVSGNTVYVIPGLGKDIKITKDCTIKSGVTLCLPYADGTSYDAGAGTSTGGVSDKTSYPDAFKAASTYCKLKVIVSTGVSVTNNGNINIGGCISGGNGGLSYNSNTAGNYAELDLSGTASLKSYSVINCYGYIGGESASTSSESGLHCFSGSVTKVVFSVREHRGGSIFSGMKSNLKSSPFNRFYISTIKDVNYQFDYQSSVNGFADLYANGAHNTTTVQLIGSTSSFMFQLANGGYFKGRFSSSSYVNTAGVFGNGSLNPLSISVGGATISTSSVYLPLSWYWNISLNATSQGGQATFTSTSQDFKILPGGELTVGDGVTLNAKNIAVYNAFTDIGTGSTTYQSDSKTAPGILNVKGSISSTGLSGKIDPGSSSASISYSQDTLTTYEVSGFTGKLTSTSVYYAAYKWAANGLLNSTSGNYMLGSGGCPFTSNGSFWIPSGTISSETVYGINASSGGADAGETGKAATHYLKVYFASTDGDSVASCSWSTSDATNGGLSNTSNVGATLSLTANSGTSDITVTVTLIITTTMGKTLSATTGTYTRSMASSCFASGTYILLSNGTKKTVEDLKTSDSILSYDFETGEFVSSQIAEITNHGSNLYSVLTLSFNDGTSIDIISNHGFFDATEMKFHDIDSDNYQTYLGHKFMAYDGQGGTVLKTLVSGSITQKYTNAYSLTAAVTINAIAGDLVTITPPVTNWYNMFEVDEDFKWDPLQKESDIATYGLFTYDEVKDYIPYEIYIASNFRYFKVALGKGLVTLEEIQAFINWYNYLIEIGQIKLGV
jgi:hypothetical protein